MFDVFGPSEPSLNTFMLISPLAFFPQVLVLNRAEPLTISLLIKVCPIWSSAFFAILESMPI